MGQIKLILFDLDDTLVHFDDYWEVSMKEAFAQHHFTKAMDTDRIYEIFHEIDHRLVLQLDSQQITIEEFRIKRFVECMEQVGETVDEATAIDFENLYQSIAKRNMKPNEEVNRLIAELKREYRVGALTNGSEEWQLDKLEAIGLGDAIPEETLFISGRIGHEKPTPEIYRHVLEAAYVEPDEVLVVGDSWTNDVAGPMQQGMKAIWLNKKQQQAPSEQPQPLAIIKELEELRALLLP
ncbi:HAD-superfamily hydrolase, subfamily IA, variant 3 [Paenibacillus curdlanolyticus YK9]|uniref:HAD-superfamily hydrolase, subfamily IA, variant 3 n=1 Tax=Paenibacillus curdlanolyticus YK9 TaxID=717606 RepID=E0IDJ9_9BACL|nr:HAD family hydrolase [Paenibacillus curdlanolyticus]EFM09654.1 HAD-superfamily hydrolase, subfamily IA, variant 3 [Paenibacillus curdlanolyticus YK9]